MPTREVWKAAELVTVAEPLVVVTVYVRALPMFDGLNGRFWRLYAAIVTVVASADEAQANAISMAKMNLFIVELRYEKQ